jgi:hypothetical protein
VIELLERSLGRKLIRIEKLTCIATMYCWFRYTQAPSHELFILIFDIMVDLADLACLRFPV